MFLGTKSRSTVWPKESVLFNLWIPVARHRLSASRSPNGITAQPITVEKTLLKNENYSALRVESKSKPNFLLHLQKCICIRDILGHKSRAREIKFLYVWYLLSPDGQYYCLNCNIHDTVDMLFMMVSLLFDIWDLSQK